MSASTTVFSRIIAREIPAQIVYEDELTLAILDHNPVTKGHCIVITKEPIDHIDDCDEELYLAVFKTVQKVSKLLKRKLGPERIGLVVHGYEIPHAHVHVVPMYSHNDMKFPQRPNTTASPVELTKVLNELVDN